MIEPVITVLLIEDNRADADLIRLLLNAATDVRSAPQPQFIIHHADRIASAINLMDQNTFNIILLDLSLPDGQGLDTFRKVQLSAQNVPIVILSGQDNESLTVTAMQQGAQDYLVKGAIEGELLIRAIRHAIERQHLLIEQMRAKNQLARQTVELQNRNAELDQFAHTVAHQVQGLLGQIIGYGSLLEMTNQENLDAEGRLALKRILQSGHKMNNVLSEILLLASVDREEVVTIPLDMQRIVTEARKRLVFEIQETKAQIQETEYWPTAVGYPSWIEEVWVNYISNALKYGGEPPVLQLGAALHETTVCFWVKDNGDGISEVDQLRLFKTHTRLNPQRTRGEGLGLSIVRRIVERCGGEVGVISQLGEGSTFWFTLPLEAPPPASA
ncbi:MAG: response regulator [Ardenticatenaceae bacterium]|nr:response regulator [Ardenticatenaceae bacterium]MCB8987629.1 response regulator [Ardenticatenaceae bacterium]